MALVIAASARKHGVSDEDIPAEIGVVEGLPAPVVVHAMKARDKFLR